MEKHAEVGTQEGRCYESHIVDLLWSPSGYRLCECVLFERVCLAVSTMVEVIWETRLYKWT